MEPQEPNQPIVKSEPSLETYFFPNNGNPASFQAASKEEAEKQLEAFNNKKK